MRFIEFSHPGCPTVCGTSVFNYGFRLQRSTNFVVPPPATMMLPRDDPLYGAQVWNVEGEGRKLGILVRTLVGHGHRINTLALSCEAALRTGPFGKEECALKVTSKFTPESAQAAALERYNLAR